MVNQKTQIDKSLLRDYFASLAMQAFCSHVPCFGSSATVFWKDHSFRRTMIEEFACGAYEIADIMLEVR